MEMPETRKEAARLIRRFGLYQRVSTNFIELLCQGRDGKPLPDNIQLGDYWTDVEADQLFVKACQAAGITEAVYNEIRKEIREPQFAGRMRKAGRLLGLTEAGMRQLEQIIEEVRAGLEH